jgi:hypothetical protein
MTRARFELTVEGTSSIPYSVPALASVDKAGHTVFVTTDIDQLQLFAILDDLYQHDADLISLIRLTPRPTNHRPHTAQPQAAS